MKFTKCAGRRGATTVSRVILPLEYISTRRSLRRARARALTCLPVPLTSGTFRARCSLLRSMNGNNKRMYRGMNAYVENEGKTSGSRRRLRSLRGGE